MKYRAKSLQWSGLALGCAAVVALAAWSGYWYGTRQTSSTQSAQRGVLLRTNTGELPHINPLLMCEVTTEEITELLPIKAVLEDRVATLRRNGDITQASLYVRTLNSGRWFEINPDEQYTPASLLKTAMLMAYLRIAEIQPEILNTAIPFVPKSAATTAVVAPTTTLTPRQSYTIGTYLNQLIVESDNQALEVLRAYLTAHHPTALAQTYKDLALPTDNDPAAQSITPRIYSRLFSLLYNATYLGRETSEAAIELLIASSYKNGLVAGVPAGTSVAHKFGERAIATPTSALTEQEFHDCGIVYYPGHPYFICVMTKGTDFTRMQQAIADLSRTAYEQIDAYFLAQDAATTTRFPSP